MPQAPKSEFLFYRTEDGKSRLEVKFEGDSVWLSQKLIAELYQVSIPTINEHIKTIYNDAEQEPKATIRKFLIVQKEGDREVNRNLDYYNLDMILEYREKGFPIQREKNESVGSSSQAFRLILAHKWYDYLNNKRKINPPN